MLDTTVPPSDPQLDVFVNQVVIDWRICQTLAGVRALAEFAELVTLAPQEGTTNHVDALRSQGWSDRAIHDAVQVIAYFNYINRIADGLGVAPELDQRHWGLGNDEES